MNLYQKKIKIVTLAVLFVFSSQSCVSYSGKLNALCSCGKRFVRSGISYLRKHPVMSGIVASSVVAGVALSKQLFGKAPEPRVIRQREKLFCAGAIGDTGKSNLSLLLIKAIQAGDKTKVLGLVALGVDVNKPYVFEEAALPPLMVAIMAGQDDIARCLVEHGAEVNVQWDFAGIKITPLVAAVCQDNLGMVQYLVEHGADVHAMRQLRYYNKMPVLHCAVVVGNKLMVQYLVEHGADIDGLSVYNEEKKTALHMAIELKKIDIVKCLVECGADINVGKIENGYDAKSNLKLAIDLNEVEIVKYLIEQGADVNIPLLSSGSLLHNAVYHGAFEIVKILVEAGADMYEIDRYQCFAVDCTKNEEIRRYLFSKGAMSKDDFELARYYDEDEVYKKENRLIVMLLRAVGDGDIERVQSLIALGADVNATLPYNGSGMCPLKLAISFDEVEIVKVLVEAGADINIQDTYGNYTIDRAENKEIIEYLLGKKAQSRYGDLTGMLYHAVQEGKMERVQIFVELGADVNAQYHGTTALELAKLRGNQAMISYLEEHGVNVNTYKGESYDLASEKDKGFCFSHIGS